jgi:CBS domain-containing membrane protein
MSGTERKTVSDVMTRRLVTVREADVIADIDDAMHRLRVRHMPVVDQNGMLVGLLSHPDLLHAAASFLSDREADHNAAINQVPVGRIMQREVVTVEPSDSLIEAGKLMWDAKIGCLPVVQPDGTLVGIITEADFIAVAVELLGGEIKKSDVEELARSSRTARARLAM